VSLVVPEGISDTLIARIQIESIGATGDSFGCSFSFRNQRADFFFSAARAQDDAFCAVSFFACRFSNVICLIRAESDGLQVAMSGSSLKALWTMRRS